MWSFIFYFIYLSYGVYVNIGVFNSSSCSEEFSYVHRIVVNIRDSEKDYCFENSYEFPSDNVKFSYDSEEGTVSYLTYSDNKCTGEIDWSTSDENITLGDCLLGFTSDYYVNFTVSDDFPYNKGSDIKHWVKSERFLDDQCTQQAQGLSSKHQSVIFTSSDFFGEFCSQKYISNGIFEEEDKIWEILPRQRFENECTKMYPLRNTSKINTEVESRIIRCVPNSVVLNEVVPKINDKSTYKYSLRIKSYDMNCSTYYYSFVMSLDSCVFGTKYRANIDEDSMYTLVYTNPLCESEPERFGIQKTYDDDTTLFDTCVSGGTDPMDSRFKIYDKFSLTNDPYSTSQMAFVRTTFYECDDQEAMKSIMKDPGRVGSIGTQYYDKEYCVETWGDDLVAKGKSMKGYCENGRLFLDIWEQSSDCRRGYYQTVEYDFNEVCSDMGPSSLGNIYQYILCIPRYCGDVSELDVENVCTGHGVCIGKDECQCNEGYHGTFCSMWSCFGIDKDDHEDICGGNRGECEGFDKCVCDRGYSGEQCEQNSWATMAILFSIFGSLSLGILTLCLYVCVSLVIFIILCLIATCITSICGFSFFTIYQRIKLAKFEELEDFEILLQEQMLDKDTTMAHLKINRKLFEIEYDEIVVKEKIGEGGSEAVVFLAEWRGNKVAFKCFRTRQVCSTQEIFNSFEAEVNLLANINHPNVIRFFGAALKPPRVGIVMEYCENGEILEFIQKYRKEHENGEMYPIGEKIRMAKEIISSLEYIHSRNIIHRDIKCENILLDSNENCKLMDFGISKLVRSSGDVKTKRVGTNYYMAPEIVSGNYDQKCDSFSFAILLWMIFAEIDKPYESQNDYQIELRVANDPRFRPDISKTNLSFLSLTSSSSDDKKKKNKNEGEEYNMEEEGEEGKDGYNENEDGIKHSGIKKYQWIKDAIVKCWDNDPVNRFSFKELSVIFEKEALADNIIEEEGL